MEKGPIDRVVVVLGRDRYYPSLSLLGTFLFRGRLDAELVFQIPRVGIDIAELLFHVVGGDFEVAVAEASPDVG